MTDRQLFITCLMSSGMALGSCVFSGVCATGACVPPAAGTAALELSEPQYPHRSLPSPADLHSTVLRSDLPAHPVPSASIRNLSCHPSCCPQSIYSFTTLNNIVIHLSLFSGTLCICSSCMYCTVRETFDRVTEPAISGGTLYTDFFSLYFPVGI